MTHLYYDPMGRLYRTTSTRPGYGTTVYLHDGDALVAEYDAAGTMLRRHVHGAAAGVDDPLATFAGSGTDGSTAALLKADPRGSIVATTDWNGNLQVINTYDVYGIPGTGNSGRFQYTGQVWLAEIGLYYYKARIYSPSLGRFLQTDPIGYEDDSNLYAYVGGDPVNNTDFLGLCTDEDKKCLKENVIVVRAPKQAGTGVPARSSVRRAPAGRKVVPDKKAPQSVTVDDSCKGIAAAYDPVVQSAALDALGQSLNSGSEIGFYAIRNVRSSVPYRVYPTFSSGLPRSVAANDVLDNFPAPTNAYRLPTLFVHTHPNNPPPSPVGPGDRRSATALGVPVAAIDRAGNLTCGKP